MHVDFKSHLGGLLGLYTKLATVAVPVKKL